MTDLGKSAVKKHKADTIDIKHVNKERRVWESLSVQQ